MATMFADAVNDAEDGMKSAIRGLQAWQYLIAKAHDRLTVKYAELKDLMGYPTCNPVIPALGCVAFYCRQEGLPPLSSIVINESGQVGAGFFPEFLGNIYNAQQTVFDFPWYNLIPPTAKELRTAFVIGNQRKIANNR